MEKEEKDFWRSKSLLDGKEKSCCFCGWKNAGNLKNSWQNCVLAFAWARIFRTRRFFWACRDFVLKANCHKQMSAEEQQRRFDDFEKQLDGRENRFDELER